MIFKCVKILCLCVCYYISQSFLFWYCGVLVCRSCCNKVPQTLWPKSGNWLSHGSGGFPAPESCPPTHQSCISSSSKSFGPRGCAYSWLQWCMAHRCALSSVHQCEPIFPKPPPVSRHLTGNHKQVFYHFKDVPEYLNLAEVTDHFNIWQWIAASG